MESRDPCAPECAATVPFRWSDGGVPEAAEPLAILRGHCGTLAQASELQRGGGGDTQGVAALPVWA